MKTFFNSFQHNKKQQKNVKIFNNVKKTTKASPTKIIYMAYRK